MGQLRVGVIWLPQQLLLGGDSDVADLFSAVAKVVARRSELTQP